MLSLSGQNYSTSAFGLSQQADFLVAKLDNSDKQEQLDALRIIADLGSCSPKHISAVEELLNNVDSDLVAGACFALGALDAASSAPKIASKLSSNDMDIVEAACWALGRMDREQDEIIKVLQMETPRAKAAAISALKAMSEAKSCIAPYVAQLVGTSSAAVRMAAVELLHSMGSEALVEVRLILEGFLGNENSGIVAAAAMALGGLRASATASDVSALEALLSNNREDRSFQMLSAAGVAAKPPPAHRKPACAAVVALGMLGDAATDSVPRLADYLSSKDWELRVEVLRALSTMGKSGVQLEPRLRESLADSMPAVAVAACDALGKLASSGRAGSATAEAVADLLNSQHPQVRASACRALSAMHTEVEPFMEDIIDLLKDGSPCVQAEAARALPHCGELGELYAGELCRLAFEGAPAVRLAAVESLGQMGRRGRSFADELEALWDDPDIGHAVQMVMEKFYSDAALSQPLPPASLPQEEASRIEEPKQVEPVETVPSLGDAVEPKASAQPLPVGLLFPGQGSQYVKMLSTVKDLQAVKAMLEKAQAILGYDLLQICLNGPEEKLEQTRVCQPAMYIAGLAAVEQLKQTNPAAVSHRQAVAGLSLGEYTALTVAGVMDMETGLNLVKLRGEAMQEAAEASPQSMLSVAGLSRTILSKMCEDSKASDTDVCSIANFLFPNGFSCAGSKQAIQNLEKKAMAHEDCLQAKYLKTSGAFHTDFMKPAKVKLIQALMEAEPKMKPPQCDVYMNVTGKKISAGTPPAEIVELLGNQLTSCVEWDTSMRAMIDAGINEFYECGPMKQLKAMMKRIDPKVWKVMENVSV